MLRLPSRSLAQRNKPSSHAEPGRALRLQPHDRTRMTRRRCGCCAFTVTDLHCLPSAGLPAHPSIHDPTDIPFRHTTASGTTIDHGSATIYLIRALAVPTFDHVMPEC